MEGLNPNFVEALLLRLSDYITLLVLTLLLFGLTFYSGMFDCSHGVGQLFTQCLWLNICVDAIMF